MEESYKNYKEKAIDLLVNKCGCKEEGVWKRKGKETCKKHILPLKDNKNEAQNRAEAIKKYIKFDCKPYFPTGFIGLHPYAHHLNSSQTLCLQYFSKFIDKNNHATEDLVVFIKKALGIDISTRAICRFEYKEKFAPYLFDANEEGVIIDRGYEGTSFDFHIKDGSVEIYFEIKFTEEGFRKEKEDDRRHLAKAAKYLEIAPKFLKDLVATPQEFLKQYQIYRNMIRAKDSDKYVVFITDGNNPATNQDKKMMEGLNLPKNIIFKTWQELSSKDIYSFELPFQLKAIQGYK